MPHYSNPADHILDVITPPMDLAAADKAYAEAAYAAQIDRQQGRKGTAAIDIEMALNDGELHPHTQELLSPTTPLGAARVTPL